MLRTMNFLIIWAIGEVSCELNELDDKPDEEAEASEESTDEEVDEIFTISKFAL